MADTTPKPVIFLAFANDRDDSVGYLRNLPGEARRLREVLEPAERAGLCEVVVRSNSSAGDIFKVFQDPRYRNRVGVFHYGGHANGYELLLESPEGKAAAADAGGLAAFFAQQQGLRLVFLNGCSTQQQTQELHDANVPVVISTSRFIDDKVATDFAELFYQGLAGGANLLTAFNEASAAIKTTKGGDLRALYFGDADKPEDHRNKNGFPWNLYPREGSENADQWNLPEAVGDALFGLPPLPELDPPKTPFRHLNYFRREDAEVFFGRGHQIRKLYGLLTTGTRPIILFYGQSGVGKSSLLDAGLMPRLEQSCEVRYLRRRAGGLLDTLQLAFLPDASDVPIETAWLAKEEQLKKPLIVFLDQVEEFYTQPIKDLPEELDQLLRVVKATFGDPKCRPVGKLVLGFRKEWLAELEAQMEAYELSIAKVSLEPLDRDGIIEVVQGPTRSSRLREQYGLQVETGLAEIIADDMLKDRGSAISTTLQILLSKMWTEAIAANSESPQFSQDLYQALEREGILLGDFFNQQLEEFKSRLPRAADSGLLLDVLALHTTDLGSANECSQERLLEEYAHVGDELPNLLRHCQDLYLLTETAGAQKGSTKTTRLAHDTLAPLVRDKFDKSDRPGQRTRRILDNRSVDWGKGQLDSVLDGRDLIEVEQGLLGTRTLTAAEKEMVAASTNLRRKRRFLIRGVIGTVVVAVISAAIAIFLAFSSAQDSALARALSEQSNRIAEVRFLANQVSLAQRALENNDLPEFFHHFNECPPSRERDLLYAKIYVEPVPRYRFDPVIAIAISPDGKRMLTKGPQDNHILEIQSVPIGQAAPRSILPSGPVHCATFSPDGSSVAVGGQRGEKGGFIQIWSTQKDGNSPREMPQDYSVQELAFSPLGDRIASVSSVDNRHLQSEIRVYDTQPGKEKELGRFLADFSVASVAFNPVGDRIVTGGHHWNEKASIPKLSVWDAISGDIKHSLEAHRDRITCVAWSSDGRHIISGSDDRTLLVWDAQQGTLESQLKGHSGRVKSIAISADGETLLSSSDGRLPTVNDDGWEIKLWDLKARQETFSVREEGGKIYSAQFSVPRNGIAANLVDRMMWWNPVDSTGTRSFDGHSDLVNSVRFSPDGQRIVSSAYGLGPGEVVMWGANKYEELYQLSGYAANGLGLTNNVRFNPDGRTFATASDTKTHILDASNGKVLSTFDVGSPIEFSPNGDAILGKTGITLRLLNAQSGEEIHSFAWPLGGIFCYAFSPDGKSIVVGGQDVESVGEVRLWSVETGDEQKVPRRGDSPVNFVAFIADGTEIISGSSDGTMKFWNATRDETPEIVETNQEGVKSLAASRTGRWIVSGGNNGTIKVWDAATRRLIVTIKGHDTAVHAVSFSHDERRIASGSVDSTVRTWAFTAP